MGFVVKFDLGIDERGRGDSKASFLKPTMKAAVLIGAANGFKERKVIIWKGALRIRFTETVRTRVSARKRDFGQVFGQAARHLTNEKYFYTRYLLITEARDKKTG